MRDGWVVSVAGRWWMELVVELGPVLDGVGVEVPMLVGKVCFRFECRALEHVQAQLVREVKGDNDGQGRQSRSLRV